MTTKAQDSKPTPFTSRRSGIDRRWIHSPNYQPERRRRRDRRKIHQRGFLEPLASDNQNPSEAVFPEFNPDKKSPSADPTALPVVGKWPPDIAEAPPKREKPDDE